MPPARQRTSLDPRNSLTAAVEWALAGDAIRVLSSSLSCLVTGSCTGLFCNCRGSVSGRRCNRFRQRRSSSTSVQTTSTPYLASDFAICVATTASSSPNCPFQAPLRAVRTHLSARGSNQSPIPDRPTTSIGVSDSERFAAVKITGTLSIHQVISVGSIILVSHFRQPFGHERFKLLHSLAVDTAPTGVDIALPP